MFSLEQLRDLCQEVDNYFTEITKITKNNTGQDENDSNDKVRAVL